MESKRKRKRGNTKPTRKRKRKSVEQEHPAKKILAQRLRGGTLEYQVDWEDNTVTGEVYEPTWEPAIYCNSFLVDSWQRSQTENQDDTQNEARSLDPESPSPPPPPEKRRKVIVESPIVAPQSSQEEPPPKKPRIAGTVESARFQSVSQENIETVETPREIKDSYEETQTQTQNASEHIAGTALIELEVLEGFDRDAYTAFPSSAEPSQEWLTADPEESSSVDETPPPPTRPRPFIWDEELTDISLQDSSSYQVTATASSTVAPLATATQVGTVFGESLQASHTRSEAEVESASQDQYLSGSQDTEEILSQLVEAEAHLLEASYEEAEDQTSSPESQSIIEHPSSDQVPAQSIEIAELEVPSSSIVADISLASVSVIQPAAADISSPERLSRSQSVIADIAAGELRLSIEKSDLLIESIPHLASTQAVEPTYHKAQNSSSTQFQTQVTPQYRGQSHSASAVRSEFSQYAQIVEHQQFSSSQRASTLPISSQNHPPLSSIGTRLPAEANSAPPRVSTPTKSTIQKKSSVQSSTPVTPVNRVSRSPSATFFSMDPSPQREEYDAAAHIKRELDAVRAKTKARQALRRAGSVLSHSPAPTPPPPAPLFSQSPIPMPAPAFTPSAAPMAEPVVSPPPILDVPAIQDQEMPIISPTLPVFIPVEELVAPISPPRLVPELFPEDIEDTSYLKIVNQARGEFMVPLPLNTQTRDIYYQTIRNYKTQSSTFLRDDVFSESLVADIDHMIIKLSKLCDHQDLGNDSFSTQRLDSVGVQARWAENISTKCVFFVEFLLELQRQHSEHHVVVLVRPGRMLEILEALCITHKFAYSRADESSLSSRENESIKVTLIPTGGEVYVVDPASAVIAFDTTARSVSYLNGIRSNISDPTGLAPLFSLVVNHSVEHLDRCFPTDIEDTGRKVKLISYIHHIDDNVGKLDFDEYPEPERAAKLVAGYVMSDGSERTWPLVDMPGIQTIDSSSESTQDWDGAEPMSSTISQFGKKRRSETMMSIDSPKRQKVSEDVRKETIPQSSTQSQTVEPVIVEAQSIDDPVSLLQRVTALEAQLRKQEEAANDLRQINLDLETRCSNLENINIDLENRCNDYESSIKVIQPKYQEALNERAQYEFEIRQSLEREAKTRQRFENKDAELKRVQARQDHIDDELESARAALASAYAKSTNPSTVELGTLKAERDKLQVEIETLRQRNTNLSKDIDFIRLEYQKGSSTATSLSIDLREAHALVAQLREKADGNRVRVHEIQRDNENTYHRQRIQELEAEKADLVRINEKQDEELRAAKSSARRSARGASVPGSPRVVAGVGVAGSPRVVGRILQGEGISRSNSPVVGDAGARPIGDALGAVVARFGNRMID